MSRLFERLTFITTNSGLIESGIFCCRPGCSRLHLRDQGKLNIRSLDHGRLLYYSEVVDGRPYGPPKSIGPHLGGNVVESFGRIRLDLEKMARLPGLSTKDLSALPKSMKHFLKWLILSRAATCEQIAGYFGEGEDEAQSLIDGLESVGAIERLAVCGEPRYRVKLIPRRTKPLPEILDLLDG